MDILKIEAGKKYELRNGLKTGLLKKSNNGTNYCFEAKVKEPQHKTDSVLSWKKNGRALIDNYNHRHDIIKEI